MESLVVLVSSVAMALGIGTIGLGLLVCGSASRKVSTIES